MVVFLNFYCCFLGLYEWVLMVVYFLKQNNLIVKIIVVDLKLKFFKMGLFQEGWVNYYEGMIDWIGEDFGGGNVLVDLGVMMVMIDGEEIKVDVCNVILVMKVG